MVEQIRGAVAIGKDAARGIARDHRGELPALLFATAVVAREPSIESIVGPPDHVAAEDLIEAECRSDLRQIQNRARRHQQQPIAAMAVGFARLQCVAAQAAAAHQARHELSRPARQKSP